MVRIVIDTNVFISAMIGSGYSKLIVDKIFADPFYQLCFSNEVLDEIERVVEYPHLTKRKDFSEKAQIILDNLRIFGVDFTPREKVLILKDVSDNKFLELSVAANADYLVTGNHLDFILEEYAGTKNMNPKNFWEQIINHG